MWTNNVVCDTNKVCDPWSFDERFSPKNAEKRNNLQPTPREDLQQHQENDHDIVLNGIWTVGGYDDYKKQNESQLDSGGWCRIMMLKI